MFDRTLVERVARAEAVGAEQGVARRDRREARLAWAAHPRVWAETEDGQAALPAKALVHPGRACSWSHLALPKKKVCGTSFLGKAVSAKQRLDMEFPGLRKLLPAGSTTGLVHGLAAAVRRRLVGSSLQRFSRN